MLSLRPDHITDVYCFIDDALATSKPIHRGRPALLSTSELVTILVWNTLVVQQKTLKDLYRWIQHYHHREFPHLPKYAAFVQQCHRSIPAFLMLLRQLLTTTAPVRLMDSTMLPVCKHHRANDHKVARNIADFGKNHQGWHYGFKLHASIDLQETILWSRLHASKLQRSTTDAENPQQPYEAGRR